MKYKNTNAELKRAHNLVSVGYCELQRTLQGANPIAYTASKMYGWRADVYHFDGFTLATGYGTPSHAKRLPYDLADSIEKRCGAIDNRAERLELLISEVTSFLKGQSCHV